MAGRIRDPPGLGRNSRQPARLDLLTIRLDQFFEIVAERANALRIFRHGESGPLDLDAFFEKLVVYPITIPANDRRDRMNPDEGMGSHVASGGPVVGHAVAASTGHNGRNVPARRFRSGVLLGFVFRGRGQNERTEKEDRSDGPETSERKPSRENQNRHYRSTPINSSAIGGSFICSGTGRPSSSRIVGAIARLDTRPSSAPTRTPRPRATSKPAMAGSSAS